MDEKKYPRILIIGGVIDYKWGGGITLSNLFKGWPKDKIAIASKEISKEGGNICSNYYRFGYQEEKRIWPFRLFQPKYYSGPFLLQNERNSENHDLIEIHGSKYNPKIKNFIIQVLHFLGIYYWVFRLNVSKSFVKWLKDFNPDIIYTQLSTHELMNFLIQLNKEIRIPNVIHIMDDWPNTIFQGGLSKIYWNPLIKWEINKLFKEAEGFLTICQAMSDEYLVRYNVTSKAFHNCIEFEEWEKYSRKDYSVQDKFTILYAGRIGWGTFNTIITFANAIEKLANKGISIEFQVQTGFLPEKHKREFANLKSTKINPFIPYKDLPKKLASVDMLLLPMDFDRKGLSFLHLSMPTKVPEYMVTGVPVFVFADKSTALYKYASLNNWAFVNSENVESALIEKLENIIYNQKAREEMGNRAHNIAYQNHEASKIREEFSNYFIELLNKLNRS